jgi:hypothetical protein
MKFWLAASDANISGFDLLNLFAAATSIILAVVALTLSIFFFVQSKNAADQASTSAERISSSVDRLEALFGKLYSDTFSMMRETVTDMRKHIWKPSDVDSNSKDDEAIKAERKSSQAQVLAELDRISHQIGIQDEKVEQLRTAIGPVVDRALKDQEEVVAAISTEKLRARMLDSLAESTKNPVQLSNVVGIKLNANDPDNLPFWRTLFDLQRDGLVAWEGETDEIRWDQLIHITDKGRESLRPHAV